MLSLIHGYAHPNHRSYLRLPLWVIAVPLCLWQGDVSWRLHKVLDECEAMAPSKLRLYGTLALSSGLAATLYCMHTGNAKFYKHVVMPTVRIMEGETAHKFGVKVTKWGLVPDFRTSDKDKPVLKTTVWGLDFDSPVGLAAGFDKHAEAIAGALKMGFGFVEVGTITPKEQPGNPKPRLFRLVEDGGIVNRYGFNSFGMHVARENILRYQAVRNKYPGILGINIGKNSTTVNASDDYVKGVEYLGDVADYLVINVSSPNTPGLRSLQGREKLRELIQKVQEARSRLPSGKRPPLMVKIAPDLTEEDKADIAAVVTNPESRIDGLIISNSTIGRPVWLHNENKFEAGGLSGRPLRDLSTAVIKDMYKRTSGQIPIIGVGGIACGQDAYDKIRSGASLVQLYTAMALDGPPVVNSIKTELAELLRRDGWKSVKDAVGADVRLK